VAQTRMDELDRLTPVPTASNERNFSRINSDLRSLTLSGEFIGGGSPRQNRKDFLAKEFRPEFRDKYFTKLADGSH